MNVLDRPIHPTHRQGILHAVARALDLQRRPELAAKFLSALVTSGVTYERLMGLSERAVSRAVYRVMDAEKVEIAEDSIEILIGLFPLLVPTRRVCGGCEHLDLRPRGGKWETVTRDDCPQCGVGTYTAVAFTAGPRAWTTRTILEVGATHDDDRYPATDEGLAELLAQRGTRVDPRLLETVKRVDPSGTLKLTDFAEYLRHRPVEPMTSDMVLSALSRVEYFAVDAVALELHVKRALAYRGLHLAASDVDGRVTVTADAAPPSPPAPASVDLSRAGTAPLDPHAWFVQFAKILQEVYPNGAQIEQLVQGIVPNGEVYYQDPSKTVWHAVLQYCQRFGKLRDLLETALAGPCAARFAPLVPGFIDVNEFGRKFFDLPLGMAIRLARIAGVPDLDLGRITTSSSVSVFQHAKERKYLAQLYTATREMNLL